MSNITVASVRATGATGVVCAGLLAAQPQAANPMIAAQAIPPGDLRGFPSILIRFPWPFLCVIRLMQITLNRKTRQAEKLSNTIRNFFAALTAVDDEPSTQ
ncbi:hypothetical protein [Pseudomonas sp. UBA6310]|uniref:hypothetical protein n=1 Tax=Pseudomonas sp. UBA6310 TaxID=1947327 RepID=UPI002579DEA6|nr:hypothetical protein [Pseudomonas sp. UBA6310]